MQTFCGSFDVGLGFRIGMLSIVSSTILKSLRLAPSTASPTGTPAPSVSRLRLTPSLARSVGFGPVFFPAERCLAHRAIHRQPSPVDAFEFVVVQQALLPEVQEDSRCAPRLKPAVGRRTRADARPIQCVPLTSGPQHEEDGVHGVTGRYRWLMTPERVGLGRWKQRFHLLPQCVRNAPAVVLGYESHGFPSLCGSLRPLEGLYAMLAVYRDRL